MSPEFQEAVDLRLHPMFERLMEFAPYAKGAIFLQLPPSKGLQREGRHTRRQTRRRGDFVYIFYVAKEDDTISSKRKVQAVVPRQF